MRFLSGFTLIEILLSIALTLVVGVGVAPSVHQLLFSRNVPQTADALRSLASTARGNSLSGKGGSEWGVAVRDDRIIAFRGVSYDGRDVASDIQWDIPENVSITGWEDIVFARVTGAPSVRPTVVLYDSGTEMALALNPAGVFEEL